MKNVKCKMTEGGQISLFAASDDCKSVERSRQEGRIQRQMEISWNQENLPILLSGTFKSQQR